MVEDHPLNTEAKGVLILPYEQDTSPPQVYPPAFGHFALTACQCPLIFVCGEKHCESVAGKEFCPRTQHNDCGQGFKNPP